MLYLRHPIGSVASIVPLPDIADISRAVVPTAIVGSGVGAVFLATRNKTARRGAILVGAGVLAWWLFRGGAGGAWAGGGGSGRGSGSDTGAQSPIHPIDSLTEFVPSYNTLFLWESRSGFEFIDERNVVIASTSLQWVDLQAAIRRLQPQRLLLLQAGPDGSANWGASADLQIRHVVDYALKPVGYPLGQFGTRWVDYPSGMPLVPWLQWQGEVPA